MFSSFLFRNLGQLETDGKRETGTTPASSDVRSQTRKSDLQYHHAQRDAGLKPTKKIGRGNATRLSDTMERLNRTEEVITS